MASRAQLVTEKGILEREWKECRQTIRNFDRTLTTLRIASLTFAAALMGISTNFFVNQRRDAAFIVTTGAFFLIFFVFYLERHYRGFLLVTVDRARALERRLQEVYKALNINIDIITISVKCRETSAMISEVIREKRESYPLYQKEAHTLIYAFLELANIILLLIYLYIPF